MFANLLVIQILGESDQGDSLMHTAKALLVTLHTVKLLINKTFRHARLNQAEQCKNGYPKYV